MGSLQYWWLHHIQESWKAGLRRKRCCYYHRSKLSNVPMSMQNKKMSNCKYIMFQCYGMKKIADAATPPDEVSYRELCTKFNLRMKDMARPDEIKLLISMRRNRYHPKPVRTKGNMTLYKGPFGSVFGGTEPGLIFEPHVLNGLLQARQQTLRAGSRSNIFWSDLSTI